MAAGPAQQAREARHLAWVERARAAAWRITRWLLGPSVIKPGSSTRSDSAPQPPPVQDGSLPALQIVAETVAGALDAQRMRADALDTKGGLVLGLAGVLASIQLHTIAGAQLAALSLDGTTAVVALLALRLRPFPALTPRRIRSYAVWSPDQASLKILDTRIEMYETAQTVLDRKAKMLARAFTTVLAAVVTTVIAAATR